MVALWSGLDFAQWLGEKQSEVVDPAHEFYAQWRLRHGATPVLREDGRCPPEHLLQALWHHQRLLRDHLRTLDGRRLRVLHPGFWNRESGPDFKGAMIQFEEMEPVGGDIEIDGEAADWRRHKHGGNPAYGRVVLHVIWEGPGMEGVPTLALRPVLDAPVGELALWLSSEAAAEYPAGLSGHCSAPLARLSPVCLTRLLDAAALVRLRLKGALIQARARQVGWEQALWEGLFRGLGYKHNGWPMQRLGELRSRVCSDSGPADLQVVEARLFGISGLLPDQLPRVGRTADAAVRGLWDIWWRERLDFEDCQVPRSLWRLHGARPANHPHRRLALAARWLVRGKMAGELEAWCAQSLPPSKLAADLLERLQVEEDPFWSWHWTLLSRRLNKPQPLLGQGRLTDLAVNVFLPWLWARAVEGRSQTLRSDLERRYFLWPAGQDNAVLRLARQRLLGRSGPARVRTAAGQQGLLQVVRDFCEKSDAICSRCEFPVLAREFEEGVGLDPEL